MYLHEDRERFEAFVNMCAERAGGVTAPVIEKDYYVTMILRLLSQKLPFVVFKGGTSLSKCHKAIKRFSEDIDIAIDTSLSRGQKKNLKQALVNTVEALGMNIANLRDTRSGRDYNRYEIEYRSLFDIESVPICPKVLLETSFTAVSFPTVKLMVANYIGELMAEEAPEVIAACQLNPFEMKVQGLDRTLVDKVFAICDYYLQNRIKKHSRHIYDIYKLLQLVSMDESFKRLIADVRQVRKRYSVCPSAKDGVDVPAVLQTIVKQEIYKEDYKNVTMALLEENVSYEAAIEAVEKIVISKVFDQI